jgi:hypothetical protein
MDIHKIQERLRLKGIRIKDDDSAFHLVALNDLVLSGVLKKYSNERSAFLRSSMDIEAMRALLLEKGIRVAQDDPIFSCIAINEIILEDIAVKCQKQLNTQDKLFFTIKQPNLWSYAKVIVPIGLVSAGALLVNNAWLRQGLTLLLGGCIGAALCVAVLDFLERHGVNVSPHEKPIDDHPARISSTWSQAEFDQATQNSLNKGEKLSNRLLVACNAVLVHGQSHDQAGRATGAGLRSSAIWRGISILEKNRKTR